MKPLEVRVENRLVIFYQLQKIVEPHLLFSSVQSELLEQVRSVLADQGGNVGPDNVLLAFAFNFGLGDDTRELLLLSFFTLFS